MPTSAFDLGEEIKLRTVGYKLHSELWLKYSITHLNLSFDKWEKIKYLNDTNDGLNPDLDKIPNNSGGLYLFFIKCPIIVGITEYPFYIGRALFTEHQNLRKRVKEYIKYTKTMERPRIYTMFKYWSRDLNLAYLALNDNDNIIELEAQLINNLLFPMNEEIPEQEVRQAVKAFQI